MELVMENDYLSASSVSYYVNLIKKYPKGNNESNTKLLHEYQNGNLDARDLLIKTNLGLVLLQAKKYKHYTESYELIDIIHEGIIGLVSAIEGFDFSKDCMFSTYACECIKNEILRNLSYNDKTIRRTQQFDYLVRKYKEIIKESERLQKKIPSDEELCNILGIRQKRLEEVKNDYRLNLKSLNEKVSSEDENTELESFVVDENNYYDRLIDNMRDRSLLYALKKYLNPYQYYILYNKVFNEENVTNATIEKLFGLSHSAVSSMEKTIFSSIRKIIQTKGLDSISSDCDDDVSIEPIDPEDIISYLFYRDSLDTSEKEMYKLMILKEYNFSQNVICKVMNITSSRFNEILTSLSKKINNQEKHMQKFYQEFRREILKTYGTKIFSVDLDMPLNNLKSNIRLVSEFWNSIPECDALKIVDAHGLDKKSNMSNLILRYFNKSETLLRDNVREVEAEVNSLIFGFNKRCEKHLSGLKEFLENNREQFADYEYDYLMMKLFFKGSRKKFNAKYPEFKGKVLYQELLNKLESMYFNISGYISYNFTKEKYLSVRDKAIEKVSKSKIDILDKVYGVNCESMTISDLALSIGVDYETARKLIVEARKSVVCVYLNRSLSIDVTKEYYIPYILDPEIEINPLTREILHEYIIDGMSYDDISIKHKFPPDKGRKNLKVSTIIRDGIETIDFYRFGIFKVENKFTADEIKQVLGMDIFDSEERKIIDMKLKDKTRDEMILSTGLTFKRIAYILDKFYKKCKEVKVSGVNITFDDIVKEVNAHASSQVLNDTERVLLAEVYGIKSDANPEGIKYGEEGYRKRHPKFSKAYNKNHNHALLSIKAKRIGLKHASVAYMSREDLKKSLMDPRIPIDDKARELLNYSFELNGYPYKTLKELESIYGSSASSLKLRIQRAFVTILKYENDELGSRISYEYDVLPYLKYFAKSDQEILTDLYRDKLSYNEIADKYSLSSSVVENLVLRLDMHLHDLLDGLVNGFDFDYFWKSVDDEEVPFYGDKNKAKRIFYLYYEKRMTVSEIIDALDLACGVRTVTKTINYLMIAVLKYRQEIKKINTVSYENVKEYYDLYGDMMSERRKKIYSNYLNSFKRVAEENSLSAALSTNTHSRIVLDLIQENNDNAFSFDKTSREDAIDIIKNYQKVLSRSTIDTIIAKYKIEPRELMSGSEQMKVLRYLSGLNCKGLMASIR